MTVDFYNPLRRQTVVIGMGRSRRSHYLDRHGRVLCGAHKSQPAMTVMAQTLDLYPTCGWCRLLIATPEDS